MQFSFFASNTAQVHITLRTLFLSPRGLKSSAKVARVDPRQGSQSITTFPYSMERDHRRRKVMMVFYCSKRVCSLKLICQRLLKCCVTQGRHSSWRFGERRDTRTFRPHLRDERPCSRSHRPRVECRSGCAGHNGDVGHSRAAWRYACAIFNLSGIFD